jgi:hypothetical protein
MRFSSLPTLHNATRTLFLLCLLVIVTFFIVPQKASAQMTSIFSDDFTDTAGTPLARHHTNWTILEGAPHIQKNTLYMPDPSFIDIQLPSYDQCAAYDFQYPLIGRKELYLRAKDTPSIFAQHGYYFLVDDWLPGEGNVHVADEFGWVTEEFSLRNLSAGWHNFKACAIGTQLTAYIDNAVTLTATARHYIADGYP